MACADVLHGFVTTTYFYPPIVLKVNDHLPRLAQRIIMAIDWTAWGITITSVSTSPIAKDRCCSHMSAIAVDRVIAVLMFARYMQLVTARRAKLFCATCWTLFLAVNTSFFAFNFCCIIVPQAASDYYSFGYDLGCDRSDSISSNDTATPRMTRPSTRSTSTRSCTSRWR